MSVPSLTHKCCQKLFTDLSQNLYHIIFSLIAQLRFDSINIIGNVYHLVFRRLSGVFDLQIYCGKRGHTGPFLGQYNSSCHTAFSI